MTPSPPSATSDARPSRPGIEDVDSTPVTLGCPLCDMKVVKEEEDTTAWSRVYHHIQHHHRSGLLRSGLLRVTLPGNPTSILYTCHRHECWTLPAKPRSRRESRVGPKTPEGLVESSRGEERPNRGRHFHCPLCGVLCVADQSGEGVKMHLLGCRKAPRRKMGPSMIKIEKAGEIAVTDSDSYTVDGIRPLNAGAEDRTRDHGLRFHNEVATRSFPRVLSFLEQLDSPGVAHRSPRKKYRKLYDLPAADDSHLDDYIDALCVNALENRGLDLTGAKYTIVGRVAGAGPSRPCRGAGDRLGSASSGVWYHSRDWWRFVWYQLHGSGAMARGHSRVGRADGPCWEFEELLPYCKATRLGR
ncbi:hypothetical protein FOZ63_004678 [Perkinsus olseni]|uniref:Uncharacterized protein n=1 Tax=Perkinsus olseni TaxID=32597 RepID=A0A7J6NEC1_PEROL|nr:hypothetical protein FOZ63_004678 [Perkinsus olseni]